MKSQAFTQQTDGEGTTKTKILCGLGNFHTWVKKVQMKEDLNTYPTNNPNIEKCNTWQETSVN